MSKESWVGFPDVTDVTGGDITIGHTGMPVGLDLERIQLNVNRLRRGVITFGGYEGLILSAYEGDADQYSYGFTGVDGSAVGQATGVSAVSRAESSESVDNSINGFKNAQNFRNGELGVQWNINALNSRIETHMQYDPEVRAKQLQKEIFKNCIKGIVRHNIVTPNQERWPFNRYLFPFWDAMTVTSAATAIATSNAESLNSALSGKLVMTTFLTVLNVLGMQLNGIDSPKNVLFEPFFVSCRPTYTAIATGALATGKLVRATPTKKYQ